MDYIIIIIILSLIVISLIIVPIFLSRIRGLQPNGKKKRVAFVHLDLGIGGAERLVVDAAVSVQSKGHEVTIFTTNHPKDHCFPETLNQLKVKVHGSFIPHQFMKKAQIVCSILRISYLAWKVVVFEGPFDVIFCDGISACIPILKLSPSKILFYCHFPDSLLVRKKSFIRSIYRLVMDKYEELTTRMSDKILVNSNFTLQIFKKTFKSIKMTPEILYPCVNVQKFDMLLSSESSLKIPKNKTIFLSLNRFDPSKNVQLAIVSYSKLMKQLPQQKNKDIQLVVAGGYDVNVQANQLYLEKLQLLTLSENLTFTTIFKQNRDRDIDRGEWKDQNVIFLPDVTEQQKIDLLKSSIALLYTPSFEHFGIVPVESMLSQTPVIAINNGGPLETVTNQKQYGILCDPANSDQFSTAMKEFVDDVNLSKTMGAQGRERAISKFSSVTFANQLDQVIMSLSEKSKDN